MFRKFFLKATALIIILTIIGACSAPRQAPITILPTATGSSSPVEVSSTPTIDQRTFVPADGLNLKDIRIVFWHPWTGTLEDRVHALVQEFNQVNEWGIMVEDTAIGDESYLIRKTQSSINEQKMPDLVTLPIHSLSSLYTQNNVLVNLEPYIENTSLGLTDEEILTYPVTFWQQEILDGFRFGVPAERDVRVLFYNRSWAQELGFERSPTDPNEFINQACAAARENSFDEDDGNDGTGGWIYDTDPMTVLSWFKAFKGGELPASGGSTYDFETIQNEEALAFLNRIYRISCAWIGREPQPYLYFANRQALFYAGWLSEYTEQEKISNVDDWEIIPFMSVDGEPVLIADGFSYGVMKSDPAHQLAAWLFIRWMLQPENQASLVETTGTLPLTNAALTFLEEFRKDHPAWNSILIDIPLIRPMNTLDTWEIAGRVLQDAAWQVTLATVKQGDMPFILEQADKLLREVLSD